MRLVAWLVSWSNESTKSVTIALILRRCARTVANYSRSRFAKTFSALYLFLAGRFGNARPTPIRLIP
jgi:hypothetical protein